MGEVPLGTVALYGALITAIQAVVMTVLIAIIAAFKDQRDADLQTKKEEREAKLRMEKEDRDNARQDEVAERAARLGQKVVAATELTAKITAEAAEKLVVSQAQTAEQLQKIHTLVNSDMTAARTAERDSQKLLVIALRKNLGMADDKQVRKEIAEAEERIDELNRILADRLASQNRIDEEEAARKAAAKEKA